jgi:hypothetical protein
MATDFNGNKMISLDTVAHEIMKTWEGSEKCLCR